MHWCANLGSRSGRSRSRRGGGIDLVDRCDGANGLPVDSADRLNRLLDGLKWLLNWLNRLLHRLRHVDRWLHHSWNAAGRLDGSHIHGLPNDRVAAAAD